jgi:hypothetical protein
LLEKLDEESHKHAFAVSTDLKFGAQKAIELLGNEAIRYRLEVQKKKTYDDELDVRELTRECITYLFGCCSYSTWRHAVRSSAWCR